jgi:hypothetical protein
VRDYVEAYQWRRVSGVSALLRRAA